MVERMPNAGPCGCEPTRRLSSHKVGRMPGPDIAVLLEQGEREVQCDSARSIGNADGSWVLAVADGTSVAPEAAQAAVSVLPSKIRSRGEMLEVFAAANAAVRAFTADWPAPITEDRQPLMPYETTMCVAAWTPENGLLMAWVGDSIPFLLPAGDSRCWVGRPMEIHNLLIVGNFAVMPDGGYSDSLSGGLYWLSDSMGAAQVNGLVSDTDVFVAVLSDGAYNAYLEPWPPQYGWKSSDEYVYEPRDERGGWAGAPTSDPLDLPVKGLRVPKSRRGSAADVARWIMEKARKHELHDNTAIAVARIPKTRE